MVPGDDSAGVEARSGSQFTADQIDAEGGFAGFLTQDSTGSVSSSRVQRSLRGASIQGGELTLARFHASTVEVGVQIGGGARVHILDSEIHRAQGVRAWYGSIVSAGGGTVIESNGAEGVQLLHGSQFVPFAVTIASNGGNGISVADTSLAVGGTACGAEPTIRDNSGWGIFCAAAPAVDQVSGAGYDAARVTGNARGATNCPALGEPGRVP